MSNWITANGTQEEQPSNIAQRTTIAAAPHTEVGNGGGWESSGGGEAVSNPSASLQNRPNDDDSGGLMATVRAPSGSLIMTRNPNGNDVVMYQGMGIPLNVAANMGLVTRNSDGTFSDKDVPVALKDPTATAAATAPEGEQEEATGVSFGEAAEEALTELIAGQPAGNLFKTVDSILNTGDVDVVTIERMASIAGVEPEEMSKKIGTIWNGAYDAGTNILAEGGVDDMDAFNAFVGSDTRLKSSFTEAARDFFVNGNAEGLQNLAADYLPAMDRYESARAKELLTEAGYEFSDKPNGGIFVHVNGQPISWEVAVKQKIITFSKR